MLNCVFCLILGSLPASLPAAVPSQSSSVGVQPQLIGGGMHPATVTGVPPGMMGPQQALMGMQPGATGMPRPTAGMGMMVIPQSQPGMMGVGMMGGMQPGMMGGMQPGMMGMQPGMGMMGVSYQQGMMGSMLPGMMGMSHQAVSQPKTTLSFDEL
jgi:hypothetical protein